MSVTYIVSVACTVEIPRALTPQHVVGLLKSHSMSTAVQQSLRNLACRLERCVENCLSVYSREFAETKVELSVRVAHLLRRFAHQSCIYQADLSPLRRYAPALMRYLTYFVGPQSALRHARCMGPAQPY
jgi:hypothetical protein